MENPPRGGRLRRYGPLFLGAAIMAFGLYNIHPRARISEGGFLGLTLLLRHWFGVSPAVSGFLLDCAGYLLGLRVLGREFLKNALFASASFSLSYRLMEASGVYFLPDLSAYPLLAALAAGALVGVGVGVIVRQGGASCGDDVIAILLSRLLWGRISLAYLVMDVIVLGLSLTYIPLERILYSLLTVTVSSTLVDVVARAGCKEKSLDNP